MEKSHQGNVLSNPTKWEKWTLNDDDDDHHHGMWKTPEYAAKSKVKCCKINHYCQWQIPHFVAEWIECIDLEVVAHEYQWCIFIFFG